MREKATLHGIGENDLTAMTVLGAAFYDTLASNDAAGAADGENEFVPLSAVGSAKCATTERRGCRMG